MPKRLTGREKAQQMLRYANTGDYLRGLRMKKGFTLAALSDKVGVSINFLSELERGLKAPGDQLVEDLAKLYGIDSSEIYRRLGRIPETATTELEKSPQFQKLLIELNQNKKLTKKEKKGIYDEVYNSFRSLIKEMEAEKRR
ncbi:helix-turn-helix domain-containing protein [Heliobacterium undosum]|uniref:Helix-turn-helix domain-containing protein n=1 Tax=Heliomicrobium undosum TaxID=121734 RepID=A0A845L144_9FIRM|nr:helix-turn-helix transcriptional regulator [Heliomicrobium undosum]MZP28669.1 helix-turn-helix domain-containing protein [Heliomicrobium undosum]